MRRIELHAHRGGRGLFPENTLAAFAGAVALGVDAIELDVAVTADDVVVVSHDPWLNPDTTRDPAGAWLTRPTPPIRDLTLGQIRTFDIGRIRPGSHYAARFPAQQPRDGERVPTLAEVFASNAPARFDIELKTFPDRPDLTVRPDRMAELVIQAAATAGASARILMQSFDWRALRHLRRHHPAILLGWLTLPQSEAEQRLWWDGPAAADYGNSVPRAVVAEGGGTWSPEARSLTEAAVAEAQSLGLRVVPWGADTVEDLARVLAWNPNGIITDRPDLFAAALGVPAN